MNSHIISFSNSEIRATNRAFLLGDAVTVYFYIKNGILVLAEESYFYLMASMRKMRMNIPLTYTLEFFQDLFQKEILQNGFANGNIRFVAFRNGRGEVTLAKEEVNFFVEATSSEAYFTLQYPIEMDMLKEISVNTNLLSNIHVHCPENIYAEIYASENDLDDVILLNPHKRIARSIYGNLMFLEGNTIKVPKQTEGAYISPLMEHFVTFVHKNSLAEIEQVEMMAFQSQKAEEILVISDEKGVFPVHKIRNRSFSFDKFSEIFEGWIASF